MDREAAKQIMRHAEATGLLLGYLGETIRANAPDELKSAMLANIARCMVQLYEGAMQPVIQLYPDLDPDKQ